MILSVYKATVIWKEEESFRGLNLVKVLLEDQILYFIVYEYHLLSLISVLRIYGNKGHLLCSVESHNICS